MGVEPALQTTLVAAAAGLVCITAIEYLLQPKPRCSRAWAAWGIHVGLWGLAFGVLVLVLGRPWCAMALLLALMTVLVLVSNAKRQSLREPFIFQDYDYFIDVLRHPRLFLPFLGLRTFVVLAVVVLLALAGLMYEQPPVSRFEPAGQLGAVLGLLLCAVLLLWGATRNPLSMTFDPDNDLYTWGLLACCWAYAVAERQPPAVVSPFSYQKGFARATRPHLVAIQSESFFDARELFAGVRPDVLGSFDVMRAEAQQYGPLTVPAWGANTVRTEFAFLTGIAAHSMKGHQFTPYKTVARGWRPCTLPLFLKSLGYKTVCIHPYLGDFYQRNKVLPALGFDVFMDARAFTGARHEGAYVADAEVGRVIMEVLLEATEPLFVFAITMENHGPLHLEHVPAAEAAALYDTAPPAGCDDLDVYLRHLRHADAMLQNLHRNLRKLKAPVSLCWYGDHVPIMPAVYQALGEAPSVPYLCWQNSSTTNAKADGEQALAVHDLATHWLKETGLMRQF